MPFHLHSIPGFSEPTGFLIAGVPTTLWQITQHLPHAASSPQTIGEHEIQFTAGQLIHSKLTEEISPPINDLPV